MRIVCVTILAAVMAATCVVNAVPFGCCERQTPFVEFEWWS